MWAMLQPIDTKEEVGTSSISISVLTLTLSSDHILPIVDAIHDPFSEQKSNASNNIANEKMRSIQNLAVVIPSAKQ
jgi:hypothetical protein